ncbi:MAG: AAA family ATPase [Candidatus Omnitrophica bacterium]|jgi:CO dehydrogenase maturation factor|nr:AAA family ATPase [Candidatus Omnitrophota bacterium]
MGYIIAMAGKGGTGKTTIAALIARVIIEKKLGSLLLIDADPNSNLGELLGVNLTESIGSILDNLTNHPESLPENFPKDRFIELKVQEAVYEAKGFDLLAMGRPEGPGCYCYINNILRSLISKLANNYDYVIIDNEAGLEHLSRKTTRSLDVLLVISDNSSIGLKSAKRIIELADSLKIQAKKSFLLINRAQTAIIEKISLNQLFYLGALDFDPLVEELSSSGKPLTELPEQAKAFNQLKEIGEKIWSNTR